MEKSIEVIGPGHPLYDESIDGKLRDLRNINRFEVMVQEEAVKAFEKLADKLIEEGLTHGTGLMLGYVPKYKNIEEYFMYGVVPDIKLKERSNLITEFDRTLTTILKRDKTERKHDGAYLLTPSCQLHHGGAGYTENYKMILRAYGKIYREHKKDLKLEGGFRTMTSLAYSMLFLGALFATISAGDSSPKIYQNGRLL